MIEKTKIQQGLDNLKKEIDETDLLIKKTEENYSTEHPYLYNLMKAKLKSHRNFLLEQKEKADKFAKAKIDALGNKR